MEKDKLYDFNQYEDAYRFYGGSDMKSSIIIDGDAYMIKTPTEVKDEKRNDLNSSYSNSVLSEYIGCKIAKSIGFDVQEVLLGHYNGKLAVACKDFTTDTTELVEFSKIENRIIDSSQRGRTPKLENLERIFESNVIPGGINQEAKERYWDIFILDSLLGNFDRHCGNWGYIHDKCTHDFTNAPLYDCGSSLYPQLSDKGIEHVLSSGDEIQKRIDTFPKAALMVNDKKVNYKEFIASMENKDCNEALLRIAPKIDLDKINEIIDKTPELSPIRSEFYKTMIEARYQEIILEPYQKLEITKRNQELFQSILRGDHTPMNDKNNYIGRDEFEL